MKLNCAPGTRCAGIGQVVTALPILSLDTLDNCAFGKNSVKVKPQYKV